MMASGANGGTAAATKRGPEERTLGILMLAGSGLAFITAALPPAATRSDGLLLACAALGVCIGLGLLVTAAQGVRAPEWLLGGTIALGTGLITLATWASGFADSANADNEILYLWVALYAFYFFNRWHALSQLALIAAAYGLLLFGTDAASEALTRLIVTVGTLLVAGLLVARLRATTEQALGDLRERARRDELTGLLSRRGMNEVAIQEFARSRREDAAVGFLLVDVDHFRTYNDLQGHRAGDDLLVHIAGSLVDSTRAIDSVAYLGADEFGVILPGAGDEELQDVGERLVADLHDGWEGPVLATISVGAASGPAEGHTLDDLWQAAERALGTAKTSGGDQLRLARDPIGQLQR